MLSKEYGFFHFDKDGIKQKHLPHEQNTQYNESAFSFLSRLLEEEGIFYFFHHEKGKHIMMLADKPDIHKACDSPKIGYNAGSERGQNHSITDWRRGYQLYSGKHANIDYNYEKPYQGLEGEHKCSAELPLADKYETYCSAGQHQRQDMGDVAAKRQFHAQEFQHELISGSSNHAGFSAGCQFELSKHSNEKELGKYVLYQVKHSASDGSYLSALGAGGGGQHYSNEFICFPAKIPYSPLSITPKPQIPGPQTATVVGEGEIDTDAMGRIQVQFHWIRNKKKHEQSSCWVRVAQSWSGNGYGTWFLPRVNQEVVVHFIDGDPDRPLVTGCVYHKEARLPFALPGNKTQSGIKTQGGGSNELRFDDKKDAQEIYIHAQKDFKRVIENDETVIVVKGDHKMSIEAGKSLLEASKSITFKVGASAIQITPDKINFYSPAISQNKEPIIED
jgi:type VI secretion system secreted protein VgrG